MRESLRRALPAVSRTVTFAGVVVLVGMLPFLSGQDPAAAVLRARSAEQLMTEEALRSLRADLGLADTAWGTFGHWLGGLLRGDLGTSWVSGTPVLPAVLTALGTSLTLMGAALAVAVALAALLCARPVRRGLGGRADAGSGTLPALLTALPEFVLGAILLLVLAVWLPLLPPYGWSAPRHLVLPALTLGLPAGGLLGRLAAQRLSAALAEAWVPAAQLTGWTRGQILRAAAGRALPGLLPQIGLIVVGLTGGAVAVEQIFAVPGLGRTALGAAGSADLPLLQGCVMCLLLLGALAGLAARALARILLGRAARARALPETGGDGRRPAGAWIVPGLCAAILLGVVLLGGAGDPLGADLSRLAAPGTPAAGSQTGVAWLGADASGRDVLARVAHGLLGTVGLALVCALASWVLGLAIGLVPRLGVGPWEAANAVPPVLAGMVVAAVWGPTSWGAAAAVLAVSWAPLAAHTAALVEEGTATPYARMAPLLGTPRRRMLLRTVLPEAAVRVLGHAMLRLPGLVLALAALGFLGLGPQPPHPDWGLMLAEGLPYLERAPWAAGAPMAGLLLLAVLAVTAAPRRG